MVPKLLLFSFFLFCMKKIWFSCDGMYRKVICRIAIKHLSYSSYNSIFISFESYHLCWSASISCKEHMDEIRSFKSYRWISSSHSALNMDSRPDRPRGHMHTHVRAFNVFIFNCSKSFWSLLSSIKLLLNKLLKQNLRYFQMQNTLLVKSFTIISVWINSSLAWFSCIKIT